MARTEDSVEDWVQEEDPPGDFSIAERRCYSLTAPDGRRGKNFGKTPLIED